MPRKIRALPAVPLRVVKEQHEEMARLLVAGATTVDIAKELGYSPQRVQAIANSPAFQLKVEELSEGRDEAARDFAARANRIASRGLDLLEGILTTGTAEAERTDMKTKVQVAQDMLDREGTLAKVHKAQVEGVHAIINSDDIKRIKEAKARAMRNSSLECLGA